MLARSLFRRAILALAVASPLAQGDELARGTLESVRDTETLALGGVPLLSGRLLADLYASRGYRSGWDGPHRIGALLATIEDSGSHGLDPAHFHSDIVKRLAVPGTLESLSRSERLAADILLSDALLRYVYQVRYGRLDPAQVNKAWNHRPPIPAVHLIESARGVLEAAEPSRALASVVAEPFFYADLKRALGRYEGAGHLRELAPIPGGAHLAQGSRDGWVPLVRERLRLTGDLAKTVAPQADIGDPELFDADLRQAVVAFQKRFGLGADGVVGPATLRAMNRPFDTEKADKIRMNLERMRWFYADLPTDYVLVDVAGFMAHVVRDGRIDWSTRVVVGTPKDQTPSFRDNMEYLVFNPTWTVPPSIEKKYRGVPAGYKRVRSGGRYYLVQGPGPRNALGQVKFMFPNGHAVYLHDTPSKGLFTHTTRAYSHGCVRVQDPLKLAEVILGSPNWDRAAINRVVRTNRTRDVQLEEHLPVVLYYLTAMADENGKVSFRRDVYGRDGRLARAFAGPPSPPRIAFAQPRPIELPAIDERRDGKADETETAAPARAPALDDLNASPPDGEPSHPAPEVPTDRRLPEPAPGPTVAEEGGDAGAAAMEPVPVTEDGAARGAIPMISL